MTNRWTHTSVERGDVVVVRVGVGGGCSSMSQINSWTQLSSYSPCLNMQGGFWWGLSRAALRKSVELFPPAKSANSLIKFNSGGKKNEVSTEEVIVCVPVCNDTWNRGAGRCYFISSSSSPHCSSPESRPTSHTQHHAPSHSPFFLWAALCANYSPFPWRWVAPLFLLSWIAHCKHATHHIIRLKQDFIQWSA